MRFATLVAIAVIVSSTPGLAAPAPFAPRRDNSTHPAHSGLHHAHPGLAANGTVANSTHPAHHSHHHAHPGHAANGTVANSTHPAHHAHHHAHPDHAANATVTDSTQASKRAATSDIVQVIEAAFDSLPLARKREVITTALQELESLGLSSSGTNVDKRFKLPEISPSTESALNNAANVATIGGGIAKIWDSINYKREFVEPDERAFKIPASVTTWLKNLGNVASIGAGGAAIVGAVDGGSNSTLKREFEQAFDGVDLATLLNGATSQFENRGKISSSKTSSSETPSTSKVSGVESILGKIAGAFSLGGTGATVVSSLEGSSNSTKRELGARFCGVPTLSELYPGIYNFTKRDALHGVDIATLLDGAAPQFEDRSLSLSSELNSKFPPLGLACA